MKQLLAILLAISTCSAPATVWASGCYCAKPPKPAATTAVDDQADRYELGKKLFTGKIKPTGQDTAGAAAQQTRLEALQASLPASAQKRANLPALAGKLTPEQMDALAHYVQKRYGK